jgi:CNT family concentrative nucleoside transporter
VNYQSILGLFVFVVFVFLFSRNKKKVSIKFILIGILSQFLLALLFLKVPLVSDLMFGLNQFVGALQNATDRAAQFMLGFLAGGPAPFEITQPQNSFLVAFRVLPLILVISALSALLFHFGILTFIVNLFGLLLKRFFGLSGPLGFAASATVFFGTIESPLIVRPYLNKMTRAELLALLTCSMATIAGTVMVLYASVLEKVLPNALTHLLAASIISVPAALTLAHVFLPIDRTDLKVDFQADKSELTWIEVLLNSVQDGMKMVVSIVAIIIVMFAFIYLIDGILLQINPALTLNSIIGQILRPVMWLVGFDWDKSKVASELMGSKIVLNEFVSYLKLSENNPFNPKETLMMVYALCGFANLASCGIIIAGLTAILPQRRKEIVELTFISLFLGNITTLMTACVIGLIS